MPYIKCFYHAIWATKYRQPLITSQIEKVLFSAIGQKSHEMRCKILALNGTEDHIHVVVCITPSVAAAEWIRHVKGFSAHTISNAFTHLDSPFKWQEGYGLVTFGERHISFVKNYVMGQKEHHTNRKLLAKLEQIDEEE